MKGFFKQLEIFVDKIIPISLIILVIVLVIEFVKPEITENNILAFDMIDSAIIGIFATDLTFKYKRIKNSRNFLKKYWLEIIAILPFFLVFRVFELLGIFRAVEEGQQAVHIIEEAEKFGKESRAYKMLRYFRVFSRTPKFLKILHFFEAPKHS